LRSDSCESREFDDVIAEEQEARRQEDVSATSSPDARSDQPAPIIEETRPTKSSPQEVLVDTAGLEPEENAVDSGTAASANVKPTVLEEEAMQFSDIDISQSRDISMDEKVLMPPPATIDCPVRNDPESSSTTSQSPQSERQRPTRVTCRPP